MQAINYLEATGDSSFFAEEFSTLAFAEIFTDETNKIVINLSDTYEEDSDSILWIAIGISDEIPNYNYLYKLIEFVGSKTIGMISIISRVFDEGDVTSEADEAEAEFNRVYSESLG